MMPVFRPTKGIVVRWKQTKRPGELGNNVSTEDAPPLARSADLVLEQLGAELLIYDERTQRAHCLSETAARVWRCCDGQTSAEAVAAALSIDSDAVARAFDELRACDLIESGADQPVGSTRREMTFRVAKAGAAVAALPMIVSVAAPRPAQAATVVFCASACPGGVCANSGNCGACCTSAFAGCGCCVDPGNGSNKHCTPVPATGNKSAICAQLFPGNHISCEG